jgi:hypothetical protein
VVGDSVKGSSGLSRRLAAWGAVCRFAGSYKEACRLLGQHTFDLVLSEVSLPDGSAFRLIPLLVGLPTSFFSFHAVENGWWWLPLVKFGKQCAGEPALRTSEFMRVIEELLKQRPPSAARDVSAPPRA